MSHGEHYFEATNISPPEWILIVPAMYIAFFFIYTIIILIYPKSKKLIFCSVCASWFTVLIISILLSFPTTIVAFMIGMTVTGIAYWLDELFIVKKKEFILQQLVFQLLFTILGMIIILQLTKNL